MPKVNEVVSLLRDAIAKIEEKREEKEEKADDKANVALKIQNDLRCAFPSLSGGGKNFPHKKGKQKSPVFVIQPKDSWTHEFCLLSESNQNISPSIEQAATLGEAGLGRKKIIFPDKNGKFEDFRKVLEKEYPKLESQEGAFELLRAESGGMSRPLRILPMPAEGYSIPYLKTLVSNSTLIYIRPIKTCISKEKVKQEVTSSSPMSKCPICASQVAIFNMREHVSKCQNISDDSDNSDDNLEASVFSSTSTPRVKDSQSSTCLRPSTAGTSNSAGSSTSAGLSNLAGPSTSAGISFIDDGITSLSGIFPNEELDSLRHIMVQFQDVERAAEVLTESQPKNAKIARIGETGPSTPSQQEPVPSVQDDMATRGLLLDMFPDITDDVIDTVVASTFSADEAVESILKIQRCSRVNASEDPENMEIIDSQPQMASIQSKMENLAKQMCGSRFKLRVDEDDILNDAMAYYKSLSFDPKRPLRIQFNGQPAIDTGGVKRDFFTRVKEEFINSCDHFKVFEGPPNRLLFVYDQQSLTVGIPKMLGTIVAHSLVHLCGGFPHLAPSHYYYIATGDIEKATAYASLSDVYDVDKRDLIDKLLAASTNDDLKELNSSVQFLAILEESGKTCAATIENKIILAEAIVAYHVLVKRTAVLDNFSKGLAILGVLKEIQRSPLQFEEVFLHNENVEAVTILKKLDFSTADQDIERLLTNFVLNAKRQDLENFLKFVSGAKFVPPTAIKVETDDVSSIFASTCLFKLTLPQSLKNEEQESFNSCVLAVIRVEGGAFNTV